MPGVSTGSAIVASCKVNEVGVHGQSTFTVLSTLRLRLVQVQALQADAARRPQLRSVVTVCYSARETFGGKLPDEQACTRPCVVTLLKMCVPDSRRTRTADVALGVAARRKPN